MIELLGIANDLWMCNEHKVVGADFDLFRFDVFSFRIIYLRNHRPTACVWLMLLAISHCILCKFLFRTLWARVCVFVPRLRFTKVTIIITENLQGAKPSRFLWCHEKFIAVLFSSIFYELQNGACTLQQCYTLRHMHRVRCFQAHNESETKVYRSDQQIMQYGIDITTLKTKKKQQRDWNNGKQRK